MPSPYRKLRDYFRSIGDVSLFFRIFLWAVLLHFYTDRYGMKDLMIKMTPGRVCRGDRTRRIVVFVNWWLNRNVFMLKATCLKRSLLLYRFLSAEGMQVRIHYGVRKTDNGPDGHSWLTLESRPFLEDGLNASLYRETFVFPDVKKE